MSVHDETWDKCPKCKQTIKTWHGDFHDSGECLNFDSWFVWNELKRCKEAINESNFDRTKNPDQQFLQEYACSWNEAPPNSMFPLTLLESLKGGENRITKEESPWDIVEVEE